MTSQILRPIPSTRMRTLFLIGVIVSITLVSANHRNHAATEVQRGASPAKDSSGRSPEMLEATQFTGSLIGMQYETWFTSKNATWDTAEALPILGKYSSYDVNIIRKHAAWFEDLGINWLLIDWSNMLWAYPAWEEHQGGTRQLEETTELLFKTYSQLQEQGQNPPRIVFLLGLENGPPVKHGVQRLSKIFDWIGAHFLSNPRYRKLWLYYGGKPLITILYNPADPCQKLQRVLRRTPLIEPKWTVRWMASQLQVNHAEQCGMWSWMDGTIRQLVTYHAGKPEETVVTPSCFPPRGWLAKTAVGRDHGDPYLESWQVAFQNRPKFIQVHQWNEFAGQKKGQGYGPRHHIYGDEYNLPFSDDLEPTQLHGCAYRGCGGWGYYYMNLTKALISLYRGITPGITVMALSSPPNAQVVKTTELPLRWQTVGVPPVSYTLQLDGKTMASNLHGTSYTLSLFGVYSGVHRVTLMANGVHTYFDPDPAKLTQRSPEPLPVASTIEFRYAPGE